MKTKGFVAVLAIAGFLGFVSVSVLGESKDTPVSAGKILKTPGKRALSSVRDRHIVDSPLGTKDVPQEINYQGYMVHSIDSSAVTDTFEMTFAIFDQWRQDLDPAVIRHALDITDDQFGRLGLHGPAANWTVRRSHSGEKQPQIIVDLGYCSNS